MFLPARSSADREHLRGRSQMTPGLGRVLLSTKEFLGCALQQASLMRGVASKTNSKLQGR